MATVHQGFGLELEELSIHLAIALYGFFNVGAFWGAYWSDLRLLYERALEAADRAAPELRGQVLMRLGDVFKAAGRVDGPGGQGIPDREDVVACDWYRQSLAALPPDDKARRAAVLRRLAGVYRDLGDLAEAADCYTLAGDMYRELGDRHGGAYVTRGIGGLARAHGQLAKAVGHFTDSIGAFQELGDEPGEMGALRGLGDTYHDLKQYSQALDCFRQRLRVDLRLRDRHGEAHSLKGMGEAYLGLGRPNEAIACLERCAPIFAEIGHRASQTETLATLNLAYAAANRSPSQLLPLQKDPTP
jgi:tetratricopeptide (TPR) repeat protein